MSVGIELTETERLILQYTRACNDDGKPAYDSDMVVVCKWADEVRMQQAQLESVLDGLVNVCVQDGEVAFYLSESGKALAEQLA